MRATAVSYTETAFHTIPHTLWLLHSGFANSVMLSDPLGSDIDVFRAEYLFILIVIYSHHFDQLSLY